MTDNRANTSSYGLSINPAGECGGDAQAAMSVLAQLKKQMAAAAAAVDGQGTAVAASPKATEMRAEVCGQREQVWATPGQTRASFSVRHPLSHNPFSLPPLCCILLYPSILMSRYLPVHSPTLPLPLPCPGLAGAGPAVRVERRPRQRYLLRGAGTAGLGCENVWGWSSARNSCENGARGREGEEAVFYEGERAVDKMYRTRCGSSNIQNLPPTPPSAVPLAGPRAPGAGQSARSGRACRGGHGGVQHSAGARPPSCTLAALPRCVEGEGMEAYVTALAQIRSTSDSNLGSVQGLQTRTARDSHPRTALKDTLYRPQGIHLCTALPLQARCTGGMAPSLTWHWQGTCCPTLCGTFGQAEQMRVLGIG